jgi:hypothetical protein
VKIEPPPEEWINLERQTWELYGLTGTLNPPRLLLECQARAQQGDEVAKRTLKELHKLHDHRKKNRVYRGEKHDRQRRPEVNPDPNVQAKLGPRVWSLLIGNDRYRQSSLKGAIRDSLAWKSYLMDFLGVPEGHITHIENANRETMVNALYDLRDNGDIKKDHHILFAYAGHGSSVDAKLYSFEEVELRAGSIEALCPVDRADPLLE